MLNKILYYFLAGILLLLPLIYSLDTQQIFSVNKFTLILFFVGISGACLGTSLLYNTYTSENTNIKTSLSFILFSNALFIILAFANYFSETPIISFFGSDSRHFGSLFLISLFITFIVVSNLIKTIQKKIILLIFIPILIAGIISSLWAIGQFTGNPPVFKNILNFESLSMRSFAGMGQPNFCAQFLIFPFFITCYFLIKNIIAKNTHFIILHANILILYIIALYTTGSRAGMLGFLTGIATLFFVYLSYRFYTKNKIYSKHILYSGVSTVLLGVFSLFLIIFIFGDSISLYLGNRGDSIAARFYFWNEAINIIKNNFLTGVGADMMNIPLGQSLSVTALEPENFSAIPDRSHSIIFDIFLQYGVFGFLLFIFGIWKTITTAFHNIFTSFSYKNRNNIDIISIVSLSAFIGILTTWTFGFAVLTDSFVAIIFLALIFRNSLETKYIQITNQYIVWSLCFVLISFSFFTLHTAHTINKSEKALFSLSSNTKLSETEIFNLSEKIINTPYLSQNLFNAYQYFSNTQQIQAQTIAQKNNLQTSRYYQIKLYNLVQENKRNEAQIYLKKLETNAGNLFTKQLQIAQIAYKYNLISTEEHKTRMKYIANNLIPAYYFNFKNNNDKKFQKFWNHHIEYTKQLIQYRKK